MRGFRLFLAALLVSGFAPNTEAAAAESITTKLVNAKQQEVGEATLTQTPNGVLIRVNLKPNADGIAPGAHAIHIHEVAKCEPPFKSAGGHFNPAKKQHGFLDEKGQHAGDLPNIYVQENTPLTVEFLVAELSLGEGKANLLDRDGSALVIHQDADDYHTDPAGDAGDRIACGVIEGSAKK